MKAKLITWLWPALEPLVAALVARVVAEAMKDVRGQGAAPRSYINRGPQ